jgi:hypothetical protein
MEKHKVITQNLAWYGIHENAIVSFTDNRIYVQNPTGTVPAYEIEEKDRNLIRKLVKNESHWFNEIK